MANRNEKGVNIIVHKDFFKQFEKDRVFEQNKMRMKMGGNFNLTQKGFTSMLSKNGFKFSVVKKVTRVRRKKIRRKR